MATTEMKNIQMMDKEGRKLFPQIHPNYYIDKDGNLVIKSGSVTLKNGNCTIKGNCSIEGNYSIKGNCLIEGNCSIEGNIIPTVNETYNLGSEEKKINKIYAKEIIGKVEGMNIMVYKYEMPSGSPPKQILGGGTITLPCYYKVGAKVLDVYYNGELLLLSSDLAGTNGSYIEVGTEGEISNKIQITNDWDTYGVYTFVIIVRGEYTATPSLITFTLGDYQCQAEEGMTFGTWANSTYNVDNKFYISNTEPYYLFDETNGRHIDNLEDGSQGFVTKDTVIVANKTYPVYVGGPIK